MPANKNTNARYLLSVCLAVVEKTTEALKNRINAQTNAVPQYIKAVEAFNSVKHPPLLT